MYSSYSFTTCGTRWDEWSVTPRLRFTPGENTPGTHWTGGRVGPKAGLDTEVRGKNPFAEDRTSIARSASP
jgi:hypothetical protein